MTFEELKNLKVGDRIVATGKIWQKNIWTLLIKKMDVYVSVGMKLNWLIKEIIWIITK